MCINYVRDIIVNRKTRSAWNRGVSVYAFYLLEDLEANPTYDGRIPSDPRELTAWLLGGAKNWKQFSEGGCALIYDIDIAERLCSPSELKRLTNKDGLLKDRPNPRETWLECQARALHQAATLICNEWPLYSGSSAKGVR